MFALLLSNKMDPFYQICTSFPNIFFAALLIFCILYWVLAVLGLVEIEALDFDLPEDASSSNLDNLNVMSGLLLKFGLNDVPFTIILTLISLIGWVISFLLMYFIFPLIPGRILEYIVGIPILIGSIYISAKFTAILIKPLRPMFKTANQQVQKQIIGKTGIVRTGRVDKNFGEAVIEDGGAGLIVKVRSYENELYTRGDRIVLIEYDPISNIYKIVSESDFSK